MNHIAAHKYQTLNMDDVYTTINQDFPEFSRYCGSGCCVKSAPPTPFRLPSNIAYILPDSRWRC